MGIKVIYRDGYFWPLEPVNLPEGSVHTFVALHYSSHASPQGERRNCFELLGNRHFEPPGEDFKDIPPEFEDYVK